MRLRPILVFAMLLGLAFLSACKKERHDDNARPPAPSSDKAVQNHRFDGGESNPYNRPGEKDEEGEGEKKAEH